MDPVTETPTQPADYAVLTLAYGSLLTAIAVGSRRWPALDPGELAPLAAASFALAKLIGK